MKHRAMPLWLRLSLVIVGLGLLQAGAASAAPCDAGAVAADAAPTSNIFSVEGKITDICEGDDSAGSGILGTITVNGLSFNVPAGSQVDVGDPACASNAKIAFDVLNGVEPPDPSMPSLEGVATGIASGTITVRADGKAVHTAECIFVEEAENGLIGFRTDTPPSATDPASLVLSGARVQMETDPRFAPFNRIVDEAGQAIQLDQIPAGTGISAEGVYRLGPDGVAGTADDYFSARLAEALFVADLGGSGMVAIARAQCRSNRLDLRVRGTVTPQGATITLFSANGDTRLGETVAVGNEWDFRGTVSGACPTAIYARSSAGATSATFTVQVQN